MAALVCASRALESHPRPPLPLGTCSCRGDGCQETSSPGAGPTFPAFAHGPVLCFLPLRASRQGTEAAEEVLFCQKSRIHGLKC